MIHMLIDLIHNMIYLNWSTNLQLNLLILQNIPFLDISQLLFDIDHYILKHNKISIQELLHFLILQLIHIYYYLIDLLMKRMKRSKRKKEKKKKKTNPKWPRVKEIKVEDENHLNLLQLILNLGFHLINTFVLKY